MRNVLLSAFAIILLWGCAADKPQPVPAPEFDLELVSGGRLNSSELKGKVVVVDFWATWCVPCIVEIAEYHKIIEKMNTPELQFVGVTFDSETAADVLPFIEDLQIKYPITMATEAVDEGFGGHSVYPTTFLIGKDWKVYRRLEGANPEKMEALEAGIIELLAAQQNESERNIHGEQQELRKELSKQ